TPLYLSYVPSDLTKVNSSAHTNAIYYAIGDHQVIGALSIEVLTKGERKNG
ncbi:MAG: hypothetical protein HAW67_08205, partial [Endozoicomonadaceae bacterium]|nr:hypothetical protein [Endozoicomonadaceae bacterium]